MLGEAMHCVQQCWVGQGMRGQRVKMWHEAMSGISRHSPQSTALGRTGNKVVIMTVLGRNRTWSKVVIMTNSDWTCGEGYRAAAQVSQPDVASRYIHLPSACLSAGAADTIHPCSTHTCQPQGGPYLLAHQWHHGNHGKVQHVKVEFHWVCTSCSMHLGLRFASLTVASHAGSKIVVKLMILYDSFHI